MSAPETSPAYLTAHATKQLGKLIDLVALIVVAVFMLPVLTVVCVAVFLVNS